MRLRFADYDLALNFEPGVGPALWDQKILSLTRLENVEWIASRVPNLAINVCFMLFAGVGLAFNIITRCVPNYLHRFRSR